MTVPIYPLYQGLQAPLAPNPTQMHMGLWFERYFSGYEPEFNQVSQEARSQWLRQFDIKTTGRSSDLQAKAEKIRQLALSQGGQVRQYESTGPFVTGLGNPHPLENGFLWHPTLGVPYLPGSAAKGLVRALVETAWQGADKDDVLLRWFGSADKDDVPERSGAFIFMDALPLKPCALVPEVMTPHMGKWYEKGASIPQASNAQPGDWHSPVPVGYLTARNLHLQFAIVPRPGTGTQAQVQKELDMLWQALDAALQWLGAGGKTALGFGLMQSQASKAQAQLENSEQWQAAQVKFNRGNGALVLSKSGKTASALGDKAQSLLQSLPQAVQDKIRSGAFVKITAYIDQGEILQVQAT